MSRTLHATALSPAPVKPSPRYSPTAEAGSEAQSAQSAQIALLRLRKPTCTIVLIIPAGETPSWLKGLIPTGESIQLLPASSHVSHSSPVQALDLNAIYHQHHQQSGITAIVCSAACATNPNANLNANPNAFSFPLLLVHDAPGSNGVATPARFPVGGLFCPPDGRAIRYNLRGLLSQFATYSEAIQERDQLKSRLQAAENELAAMQVQAKAKLAAQEQSAQESHLIKNAIVRNVSHELKTPLLHLKSAVSQLAESVPPEHALLTRLTDYAVQATRRLEEIVGNIVQLSSWANIKQEAMSPADSLELAMRVLRRSWANKDRIHRVDIRMGEPLPAVLGDKFGIATVLQLLIDNALKFSENMVTISIKATPDGVVFAIADRGIGIASENLQRMFDLFVQGDNTETRTYGGIGVGLAIVKLILDRHAAQIAVQSEKGKGTTFSFVLPAITLPL